MQGLDRRSPAGIAAAHRLPIRRNHREPNTVCEGHTATGQNAATRVFWRDDRRRDEPCRDDESETPAERCRVVTTRIATRKAARSYDPNRHQWYPSASRGYESRYGLRGGYANVYREGLEAGYAEEFRESGRIRR